MRALIAGFLGFLAMPAAMPLNAAEAFAFPVFNQSALARLHALPAPGAAGQAAQGQLQLDWTNDMVLQRAGNQSLRLDGESLRLAFRQYAQWGDWWVWAELPLLTTTGGVLDNGIETWHRWFGMPNGGRGRLPRDDYRLVYTRGADTVFDVTRTGTRLGDPRLGAARCDAAGRCLNLMLQLPVADADRLEGGGLGAAAWYEQAYRLGAAARWHGALAAGLSATKAEGPLRDQVQPLVPFGWASLAYALTPKLDAGVQFHVHAPLYDDSRLDALRREGVQLSFGFRHAVDRGLSWTLALQEDLVTSSSPDFSIHLGVIWR